MARRTKKTGGTKKTAAETQNSIIGAVSKNKKCAQKYPPKIVGRPEIAAASKPNQTKKLTSPAAIKPPSVLKNQTLAVDEGTEPVKTGEKDDSSLIDANQHRRSVARPPVAHRATGRRHRKQFNPNAWSSSILTRRTNVLCLGVSYPCVERQIRAEKLDPNVQLHHVTESVEQAIELVRRNLLTEMDGRDLARCLALEAANDTLAYTVSMEEGAMYSPRHLKANFNRQNFALAMKKAWGSDVKFRQVILDYFWIPRGSWVISHWSRSFFSSTLPKLVVEGLFEFGSSSSTVSLPSLSASNNPVVEPYEFVDGVVYLPFCLHCVKEVVASLSVLSKFYAISFLYKWELSEHSLWAATNTISPDAMQSWLGKSIEQEEIYCTFTPQEVFSSTDDEHVRKEDVLKVLRGIEDFDQVRMIKLTVLRKFDPSFNGCASTSILGVNEGGFVGLKEPKDIVRGFDQYQCNSTQPLTATAKATEDKMGAVAVTEMTNRSAPAKCAKRTASKATEKSRRKRKVCPPTTERCAKKVRDAHKRESASLPPPGGKEIKADGHKGEEEERRIVGGIKRDSRNVCEPAKSNQDKVSCSKKATKAISKLNGRSEGISQKHGNDSIDNETCIKRYQPPAVKDSIDHNMSSSAKVDLRTGKGVSQDKCVSASVSLSHVTLKCRSTEDSLRPKMNNGHRGSSSLETTCRVVTPLEASLRVDPPFGGDTSKKKIRPSLLDGSFVKRRTRARAASDPTSSLPPRLIPACLPSSSPLLDPAKVTGKQMVASEGESSRSHDGRSSECSSANMDDAVNILLAFRKNSGSKIADDSGEHLDSACVTMSSGSPAQNSALVNEELKATHGLHVVGEENKARVVVHTKERYDSGITKSSKCATSGLLNSIHIKGNSCESRTMFISPMTHAGEKLLDASLSSSTVSFPRGPTCEPSKARDEVIFARQVLRDYVREKGSPKSHHKRKPDKKQKPDAKQTVLRSRKKGCQSKKKSNVIGRGRAANRMPVSSVAEIPKMGNLYQGSVRESRSEPTTFHRDSPAHASKAPLQDSLPIKHANSADYLGYYYSPIRQPPTIQSGGEVNLSPWLNTRSVANGTMPSIPVQINNAEESYVPMTLNSFPADLNGPLYYEHPTSATLDSKYSYGPGGVVSACRYEIPSYGSPRRVAIPRQLAMLAASPDNAGLRYRPGGL